MILLNPKIMLTEQILNNDCFNLIDLGPCDLLRLELNGKEVPPSRLMLGRIYMSLTRPATVERIRLLVERISALTYPNENVRVVRGKVVTTLSEPNKFVFRRMSTSGSRRVILDWGKSIYEDGRLNQPPLDC